MRLLQVSHSAQPGGSNVVLVALLRHAPAAAQCHCVFLEEGPVFEQVAGLAADVQVIAAGRARQAWRAPAVVARLTRAMRRARAHAVLAHVSKAHVYAAPAARLAGVPEVWWQHEHLDLAPRLQALAGRIPAAAVICDTAAVAAAQHGRFPRTPAVVVAPGAEIEPQPPVRRQLAGTGEPLTIGVVGRLQRWKRIELVLGAMAGVCAREPRARLLVVGGTNAGLDGGYEDELRRRASQLGIEGSVTFTGQLVDAAPALDRLDLLVHAADREPFGLVMVEALARGIPVIAPPDGGGAAIVRDGIDGLLIDPTDTQTLANAMVTLLRDPVRREAMGRSGRARAGEHFTADRMAARAWGLMSAAAAREPLR